MPGNQTGPFDPHSIRSDFPALQQKVNNRPLVYLDNAATTQKPQAVLEALERFYREDNAAANRGVHQLAQRATLAYERARSTVQQFLNADSPEEIIFVRNTTEAINLVAMTYGEQQVTAGDEVLVTEMEHHSNLLPWQALCERKGAMLRVLPVTDDGRLQTDRLDEFLTDRTRLFCVTHLSNAIGTVNPVAELTKTARRRGVPWLVDGAQGIVHLPVDVQKLSCDFYAFSGHKIYGPMGIGVLYARKAVLERMPPFQRGGGTVLSVAMDQTQYASPPACFEAGTPNIPGAIGLAAALQYIAQLGLDRVHKHEEELLIYAQEKLQEIEGVQIVGGGGAKAGALSFVVEGAHPHDIGTLLDEKGIAVRAGHHCSQPLLNRLGHAATTRVSVGMYTTREEIDRLIDVLPGVIELLS